jgi:hypothetical protein
MNVTAGTSYYPLPENITASVSPFEPDIDVRRHAYRAADMGLVTVLQKVFATPSVAPIDVQTGTRTDDKVLEGRYWSVFKPDAFDALPSRQGGHRIGARVAGVDLRPFRPLLYDEEPADSGDSLRTRLVNDAVETLSHAIPRYPGAIVC